MVLTIKYLGLLAEITQCSEEQINFTDKTISDLLKILNEKYPNLKDKDFQVAQNNEIVSRDTMISKTEIALLPPFSGG